jgi:2-C-methyl-D-erythritol 4-phosphate cytidylyltransferase/2-C-methyl-D-erythritol 2,4-cyclodiphosphate synthase
LTGGKVKVVEGGDTRLGSVINGFRALSESIEVVAVHDGARPLVGAETIRATFEAALECGAAVAAVPAKDTIKEVEEGIVAATPDRARFWQAQTPQTYRRDALAEALERFGGERDATDESQLVEKAGHKVRVVRSGYDNLKITTPEDLVIAEALMRERSGTEFDTRAGFGYDIHRLVEGRPMVIAGATLEHPKGPQGHSDGDVVLHAASDAVLGALGAGEIGIAFPPSDPKFKGISSRKIVEHVLAKVTDMGADIVSLDVTIVAEEPKIKPHYGVLKKSLAEAFALPEARVNLKAKSHEGIGEIGRGEAIACYAAVSLRVPRSS